MSHPLLFLPGAGADPAFWRPVGDRLPAAWRKTYLAWPGIGNQPAQPGVDGFDDLVTLVGSQLGDTPTDLVAQSMGGAIALRVALQHPGKIRRLVLTATSGGIDVTRFRAADWRPEYRTAFPRAAAWITEARPDFANELPRIAHPTLLLWGDSDPISPVGIGERLRQLLPNAKLQIVPGGDHGFAHDQADVVASAIERHLAGPPE
ncbi:MAG TPA: alpha/beta hydrolase [Opitutaceae bacterium]|nr:alpha/beta hydrolase [Opitutaceae bacterium]